MYANSFKFFNISQHTSAVISRHLLHLVVALNYVAHLHSSLDTKQIDSNPIIVPLRTRISHPSMWSQNAVVASIGGDCNSFN